MRICLRSREFRGPLRFGDMSSPSPSPPRADHPEHRIRECLEIPALPEELVAPPGKISWWERALRCLDPRVWIRTIIHLDDTPHSLALGTAIGVFIGLTPTVGIQMVLVMITAFLTRRFFHFNRIAGLLGVYISNPVTTIPLYWYSYRLGTCFFEHHMTWAEFKRLFTDAELMNWWGTLKTVFFAVGPPLIVGSIVLGAILAVISYVLIYVLAARLQRIRQLTTTRTNPDPAPDPAGESDLLPIRNSSSQQTATVPHKSELPAEECA